MKTIFKNKGSRLLVAILIASLVLPAAVFSQSREELEAELKKIEEEIASYEKELATTKSEKQTLANKISQLKKEQEKITLQIRSINIRIKRLGNDIAATAESIEVTTAKLNLNKEQISAILRELHIAHDKSLIEILLEPGGLAEFARELEALRLFSRRLTVAVVEAKAARVELETKRAEFEVKQGEQKNFLAVETLQKQNLLVKTAEQNNLLKVTRGREDRYQAMLADSKKRAQEIRNRIYELLGVSRQITFGEAVEIARWVSGISGVRAEFLLAVLTQESNLGKNVGTCNRPGDPPAKGWQAVMKPGRDQEPFLSITKELGLDPDITPVSCPMRGANGEQIGWGGAMGPAQFIPSTWVLYKERVAAVTGKSTANPWDIRDAFIAAALLLKDNGASGGGSNAEWRAAMLYFSGSTNPRFRFYGDNVLAIARRYEEDIRVLG